MHTIKLDISDNIYSRAISVFKQFEKDVTTTEESSAWDKLSKEEKEELLISIESKDKANLVSIDEFRQKYEKWF